MKLFLKLLVNFKKREVLLKNKGVLIKYSRRVRFFFFLGDQNAILKRLFQIVEKLIKSEVSALFLNRKGALIFFDRINFLYTHVE